MAYAKMFDLHRRQMDLIFGSITRPSVSDIRLACPTAWTVAVDNTFDHLVGAPSVAPADSAEDLVSAAGYSDDALVDQVTQALIDEAQESFAYEMPYDVH